MMRLIRLPLIVSALAVVLSGQNVITTVAGSTKIFPPSGLTGVTTSIAPTGIAGAPNGDVTSVIARRTSSSD